MWMDRLDRSSRMEFSSLHLFSSLITSALLDFLRVPAAGFGLFIVLSTEKATPGVELLVSFFPSLASFPLVLGSLPPSFIKPARALASFSLSLPTGPHLGSFSFKSFSLPKVLLMLTRLGVLQGCSWESLQTGYWSGKRETAEAAFNGNIPVQVCTSTISLHVKHKGLVGGGVAGCVSSLCYNAMGGKSLWSNWMVELMSHMLQGLNRVQPQGLQVQVVFSRFILPAGF